MAIYFNGINFNGSLIDSFSIFFFFWIPYLFHRVASSKFILNLRMLTGYISELFAKEREHNNPYFYIVVNSIEPTDK